MLARIDRSSQRSASLAKKGTVSHSPAKIVKERAGDRAALTWESWNLSKSVPVPTRSSSRTLIAFNILLGYDTVTLGFPNIYEILQAYQEHVFQSSISSNVKIRKVSREKFQRRH